MIGALLQQEMLSPPRVLARGGIWSLFDLRYEIATGSVSAHHRSTKAFDFTSELLLVSLPDLLHKSWEENVDNDTFEAPSATLVRFLPASRGLQQPSLSMCLSMRRSSFSWTLSPKGKSWKRPEYAFVYVSRLGGPRHFYSAPTCRIKPALTNNDCGSSEYSISRPLRRLVSVADIRYHHRCGQCHRLVPKTSIKGVDNVS